MSTGQRPIRGPHISRSSVLCVGGLEGVDAVAPCLLLGFALSSGSKPDGAEQGAEQQSMATRVWVDAHRGCRHSFRRNVGHDRGVGATKRHGAGSVWTVRPSIIRIYPTRQSATLAASKSQHNSGVHQRRHPRNPPTSTPRPKLPHGWHRRAPYGGLHTTNGGYIALSGKRRSGTGRHVDPDALTKERRSVKRPRDAAPSNLRPIHRTVVSSMLHWWHVPVDNTISVRI